jgi:hypothetical protein
MSASAYRDLYPIASSEIDRINNVGYPGASGYKSRTLVNHPVPYTASFVVSIIARLNQLAAQPGLEVL